MLMRQALAAARDRLAVAGVDSAGAESRTLVAWAAGVEPNRLDLIDALDSSQLHTLEDALARRVTGVPLQHLTGRAYFRTIAVQVGPGVFIPRPETEALAGWAIAQVGEWTRVVELCAGSGAISLAIAAEAHPRDQWAVERDSAAFAYLQVNLAASTVIPVLADMAEALPGLDATIDLVVANPPYIPLSQWDNLPDDVLCDPEQALFSAADGLADIALVAQVARRLLKPGGVVGCEHGDNQADQARALFNQAGFSSVRTGLDLSSRPRFVTARLPDMQ